MEKGQTHRLTYRKAGTGQSVLTLMGHRPLWHHPGTSTRGRCTEVHWSLEEVSVGERSWAGNIWEEEAAVNASCTLCQPSDTGLGKALF